jgi:ketosteroid isomerase-like protein
MKTLFILVFILIGINISYAQSNVEEAAKKEIIQINKEWINAVIKRDSVALEKILSPEFTLNGELPRDIWMNNTLHRLKTHSLKHIGDQKIALYGESAICTSTLYWKASYNGQQTIDGEFLVTDVWRKNNGKWQILIRMSKPKL